MNAYISHTPTCSLSLRIQNQSSRASISNWWHTCRQQYWSPIHQNWARSSRCMWLDLCTHLPWPQIIRAVPYHARCTQDEWWVMTVNSTSMRKQLECQRWPMVVTKSLNWSANSSKRSIVDWTIRSIRQKWCKLRNASFGTGDSLEINHWIII